MNTYATEEYKEAMDFANTAEVTDDTGEVQEKKPYEITDIDSANWALRKIAALNVKLDEVKGLANREHERIEQWEAQETKQINNNIDYFKGLLVKFYTKKRSEDPKFKLSTPYGYVRQSTRKEYNYNEDKLIKELNGTEYLKTECKVDIAKLKKDILLLPDEKVEGSFKAISADGVVLEGLTVTENTAYSIKAVEI